MRRYYEFAIAITLIGVVSFFLLASLDSVRSNMEEALVQSEAASMRLELAEAVVHRAVSNGSFSPGNNPVDWVANKPANYRGAFDAPPDERSIWYFDRQAGELVYRFHDDRRARFRLGYGGGDGRLVISGISLQRLDRQRE
jgi:hypothetical protein